MLIVSPPDGCPFRVTSNQAIGRPCRLNVRSCPKATKFLHIRKVPQAFISQQVTQIKRWHPMTVKRAIRGDRLTHC
jgi:hypothetical protein